MKDGYRVAYGTPEEVLSSEGIFQVYGVEMFRIVKDKQSYILPVWEGTLV
jgi:ABC-type cobalamin/Fe3+-siderophores transport system ATPase subunit